jgi:hypothetical protein
MVKASGLSLLQAGAFRAWLKQALAGADTPANAQATPMARGFSVRYLG